VPAEEEVKILIKILHVLGQLPHSVKDSCSIVMLNVLLELLPEIFSEYVQGKEGATCRVETLPYVRDIATNIGVLGDGEPLQVISRKLLECLVVSDGH
jgi:hypothetical protein